MPHANAVMQPTGNEVKAEAYHDHRRAGRVSASQIVVLKALNTRAFSFGHKPMTRNEIAELSGLPLSSVCGRCKELLDADLITVAGTTQEKPARSLLALTPRGWSLVSALMSEEPAHA